jgi:tetratricopeptide (TPR) repeat protein
VNDLLIGALSALLATNQPAALSNLVKSTTGISVEITDPNDPVEQELQKLMEADDAAQEEVDRWIKENNEFAKAGAGVEKAILNARIDQRFAPVRKGYEDFLQKHPKHTRALLAYGSFLNDTGDEDAAFKQWEKAREVDPKNPAAWNNLGSWYGHNSPITNAFECFEKAIQLSPKEPVYYHNLADCVYLFRHDATNYYKIGVQEVFEKAMVFYRKALEFDPENFVLATDYAQSYYGYRPAKTGNAEVDRKREQKHWQDALKAWNGALKLARDDIERQGVFVHFARIHIDLGQLDEARKHLNAITNQMFASTKTNLTKKISLREKPETEAKK